MAEFVPLGGNTDEIKKDTIDIKAAIQDLKMRLDEANLISSTGAKNRAGFYDLFRNTDDIDMVNTTANVEPTIVKVAFVGSKTLKMLPQYFDAFKNVQLSIYDTARDVFIIDSKYSDTQIKTKECLLPPAVGDRLFCKGETFTVTNVVEV